MRSLNLYDLSSVSGGCDCICNCITTGSYATITTEEIGEYPGRGACAIACRGTGSSSQVCEIKSCR